MPLGISEPLWNSALDGSDEHPQSDEPAPEFRGGRPPAGVRRGLTMEPPTPMVDVHPDWSAIWLMRLPVTG